MNKISNQTRQNKTGNYIKSQSETTYLIDKVYFYCIIVVIISGLIGNLLSLFIFTRPNLNKKTNTGILYTILCIFNLLIFIKDTFFGNYSYIFFHYKIWVNPTQRSIDFIIATSLSEILPWTQVLICFDRFILVISPMKAYIMRKKVCFSFNKYIYI